MCPPCPVIAAVIGAVVALTTSVVGVVGNAQANTPKLQRLKVSLGKAQARFNGKPHWDVLGRHVESDTIVRLSANIFDELGLTEASTRMRALTATKDHGQQVQMANNLLRQVLAEVHATALQAAGPAPVAPGAPSAPLAEQPAGATGLVPVAYQVPIAPASGVTEIQQGVAIAGQVAQIGVNLASSIYGFANPAPAVPPAPAVGLTVV